MVRVNDSWNLLLSIGAVNPENGMVITAENDDVARERELIQNPVLQKDNNLVINQ